MQDASSIDVKAVERRVPSSEIAKLVVWERNADVTPVFILWWQVARSTSNVDIASFDHAIRQCIVDLVAAPVKS